MKIITIAFKDILQSLRSFIGLVFMFGVPILMTAMFYFLFGGLRSGEEFILPKTILVVVNLDQGSPQVDQSLAMGLSQSEAGAGFDGRQ